MHKGSFLRGTVGFEVSGILPPTSACHCTQCRKHSGPLEVSTDIPRSSLSAVFVPRMVPDFSWTQLKPKKVPKRYPLPLAGLPGSDRIVSRETSL
jgi:hypothetical protein